MPRPKKCSSPGWLRSLPVDPSTLTWDELRSFKQLDQFLTEPVPGPEGFQYLLRCYKALLAFSAVIYYEQRFPAFNRCFDHIKRTFIDRGYLGDDTFFMTWVLCDFPAERNGRTMLQIVEEQLGQCDLRERLRAFFDAMKPSRMGLYEEIGSTTKLMKFRELFTGTVISAIRSVEEFGRGEIFLTRLVEHGGDVHLWGDTKCWPRSYKARLEDMVDLKLVYFDGETDEESYRQMMKLAGPYWFSCSAPSDDVPLFPPDHQLTYYNANYRG